MQLLLSWRQGFVHAINGVCGDIRSELAADQKKPYEDAYETDKAAYQVAKAEFENQNQAAAAAAE